MSSQAEEEQGDTASLSANSIPGTPPPPLTSSKDPGVGGIEEGAVAAPPPWLSLLVPVQGKPGKPLRMKSLLPPLSSKLIFMPCDSYLLAWLQR